MHYPPRRELFFQALADVYRFPTQHFEFHRRHAGLVTTEPHGRYTYYRLRPEALRTLAPTLTELADTADTHTEARRPCP